MRDGRIVCPIGTSRSGKSAFLKRELARETRLLVWDIKGEYSATVRAKSRVQLVDAIKEKAGKPGRIAFIPASISDFDFFCRCAQAWIKSQYAAGCESSLVVEETSDVTSPQKAPPQYGILLRRFLGYGVDIYAVSQRPAESDKTAIGNAARVRISRLALDRDRRSAANDTGVPLEVIKSLRADQDKKRFDYVDAYLAEGYYQTGVLTFPGGRAKFTTKPQKHQI